MPGDGVKLARRYAAVTRIYLAAVLIACPRMSASIKIVCERGEVAASFYILSLNNVGAALW